MKSVIASITFLAGLVSAKVAFTNSNYDVVAGTAFTLTWSGGSGPYTVLLKDGPSDNLATVSTLTSGSTDESYTWTPDSSLTTGTYAFEIIDAADATEPNYSSQFEFEGAAVTATATAATATSTTAAETSTAATTTVVSSVTSITSVTTTLATSTIASSSTDASSANSTATTTTAAAKTSSTSASKTTGATASSTTAPASINGARGLVAPMVAPLMIVAALAMAL